MQQRFLEYLKNECRCSNDSHYLLAVSGGVDSVVMAYLFKISGIKFSIAHCNFRLRGDESDCDQKFVSDLAESFDVPCYIKQFDTEEYAEKEGLSVQVAARTLRYEWFREVMETGRMDYLSVGHNRDDIIETFLINLSRGTGIRGLTGIKPRKGNIVRPLLFASRKDILGFAGENNIRWRDDSSNESNKYQRNVIRNIIIPEFEKIYPSFRNNVITTIRNLGGTEILYNEAVSRLEGYIASHKHGNLYIDIEKLKDTEMVETVLYEILKDYGCNQSMVSSIAGTLNNSPGRQVITSTHTITRDRSFLIVTPNRPVASGSLFIDVKTEKIGYPFEMSFKILSDIDYTAENTRASFDYDRLIFPLKLRRWKEGDRFSPLGMKGSKKVSDFLIDSKIPLPEKKNVWVMESGDEIIWVVGMRIDDRFKVTKDTKKIFLAVVETPPLF